MAGFSSNDPGTSWSVSGPDAAAVSIDPATGDLSFTPPPDFEAPTDQGGDNLYEVTVISTDASGNQSSQIVGITVTDVIEPVVSASKTLLPVSLGRVAFDCAPDPPDGTGGISIPGSCLEYRISVSSAANGSAPASNLVVSDTLPAAVSGIVAGNITGFDSVVLPGDAVTGTISSLAPGQSAELFIRVTVR